MPSEKTNIRKIAAAKAWFNMTSKGGGYFVPHRRALYFRLFVFDKRHNKRGRWIVVFRPHITRGIALAEIGSSRSLKRRASAAVKAFKEEMALREGAIRSRITKVYVRNADARRQCIHKYGSKCSICNFSFKATYGKVADGFIHVHHIRQLSHAGKEHRVDPIQHLRPVCPNCHAVVHLKSPAYSIDEVQAFLRR